LEIKNYGTRLMETYADIKGREIKESENFKLCCRNKQADAGNWFKIMKECYIVPSHQGLGKSRS